MTAPPQQAALSPALLRSLSRTVLKDVMKSHAKAKLTCVPVVIAVAHRLRQQFPRSLASPARRRVVTVHSSSVMPKKLAIDLNLAARTRTIPTATQRLGPVEEAEAEIFARTC
jgi:hypothetical protein